MPSPFVPTSSLVAKVAIEYSYQLETMVNTLWFERTDENEWDSGSLGKLLDGVSTWLGTYLMAILNTGVIVTHIYASRQDSQAAPYSEQFPVDMEGQVIGEGEPANVCVSVKFGTNLTGRSYRGRNFIGGLPPGAVNGSTVDADFKGDLIATFGLLNGSVQAEIDAQHVVVSKKNGGAWRTTAVTVPVQVYAVRKQKVNTMRSRVKD